jgi:acetoacetyl-CoA reductase/3-oxoacyl-[acyl-carrier protein] reductase
MTTSATRTSPDHSDDGLVAHRVALVTGGTRGIGAADMVAGMPDKALDRVRSQIPIGRLGRPEEVARVVAFLAADGSGYITGQVWAVNGGLDM